MILNEPHKALHDDRSTVTMVDILKQVGTADWDRERLNWSVNTPASWSAHTLRTRLVMLSGPAAVVRGGL